MWRPQTTRDKEKLNEHKHNRFSERRHAGARGATEQARATAFVMTQTGLFAEESRTARSPTSSRVVRPLLQRGGTAPR
jgi:hypothetical protein